MGKEKKVILEINNGNFSFKERQVLKNINISIKNSEFIGVTGKNGSGKSTLTKILSGLDFLDEGKLVYRGKEIDSKNIFSIRKMISLVFQNPNNQIVANKVIDDLAFGLENIGMPRKKMITKIYEVSKRLKIEKLLHRNPNFLSGGQKQKVAIAGILVLEPEIIILDEITSMLDLEAKEIVFDLVLKLKEKHTIILISHDSRELMRTDRIILLENGEIKEKLTPKELFRNKKMLDKYTLEQPFEYLLEDKMKKS